MQAWVECKCREKCKHECEAKVQNEMYPGGVHSVVPFLSVCTGDISTKAMVGADVALQVT